MHVELASVLATVINVLVLCSLFSGNKQSPRNMKKNTWLYYYAHQEAVPSNKLALRQSVLLKEKSTDRTICHFSSPLKSCTVRLWSEQCSGHVTNENSWLWDMDNDSDIQSSRRNPCRIATHGAGTLPISLADVCNAVSGNGKIGRSHVHCESVICEAWMRKVDISIKKWALLRGGRKLCRAWVPCHD